MNPGYHPIAAAGDAGCLAAAGSEDVAGTNYVEETGHGSTELVALGSYARNSIVGRHEDGCCS